MMVFQRVGQLLCLVVVFDEATNLFSTNNPSDIDTGRYVALNRVISCLKEISIWFFMLFTESRVENLLPPDTQPKVAEKKNGDRWSKPSGRRSLLSDQADN